MVLAGCKTTVYCFFLRLQGIGRIEHVIVLSPLLCRSMPISRLLHVPKTKDGAHLLEKEYLKYLDAKYSSLHTCSKSQVLDMIQIIQ